MQPQRRCPQFARDPIKIPRDDLKECVGRRQVIYDCFCLEQGRRLGRLLGLSFLLDASERVFFRCHGENIAGKDGDFVS
jgi:hypothetical protein